MGAGTADCRSLVTLEFLPRSHQPIRFEVTSSHENLIGSCDLGSTCLVTSNLQSAVAISMERENIFVQWLSLEIKGIQYAKFKMVPCCETINRMISEHGKLGSKLYIK